MRTLCASRERQEICSFSDLYGLERKNVQAISIIRMRNVILQKRNLYQKNPTNPQLINYLGRQRWKGKEWKVGYIREHWIHGCQSQMLSRKSGVYLRLLFRGRHPNWGEVSRKSTAFASKVHSHCGVWERAFPLYHSTSCWVTTPVLSSSPMALSSYRRTSFRMYVVCCPSRGGGLASDILNLLYLTAGPVKRGGTQETCYWLTLGD